MADDASKHPRPFDLPTIRSLVALMSRHDLSEIDLQEGDQRIQLRRGPKGVAVVPAAAAPPEAQPAAPSVSAPVEPPKPVRELHEIKSQLVGTFYSASSPGASPFVKVGDRVTPATIVGIIEAMKIFNEIPAECSGVVVEVLVENQQPVEFEQVLFRVDPTG